MKVGINIKNEMIKCDAIAIITYSEINRLGMCAEVCLNHRASGKDVLFSYVESGSENKSAVTKVNKFASNKDNAISNYCNYLIKNKIKKVEVDELSEGVKMDLIKFSKTKIESLSDLRLLQYKEARLGMGVMSSIVAESRCSQPDLEIMKDKIEKYLFEAAEIYEKSMKLIKQYNPNKVLLFNGRHYNCKPIAEAAIRLSAGIEYFEMFTFNGYRLHTRPKPIHDLSYSRELVREKWLKADENKVELAKQFFNTALKMNDSSVITFVQGQVKGLVPENKGKRRFVYYSSSDDEYATVSDLVMHTVFDSQKKAVMWLIQYFENLDNSELIIRVHPHKSKKCKADKDWWNTLGGKNVELLNSDSKIDTYALAQTADVVICYNSTIGLESSYNSKPVIVLGEAFYKGFDCVYEPVSIIEFEELLRQQKLETFPRENCLPLGYYFVTRGEPFKYYTPTSLTTGFIKGAYLGPWRNRYYEYFSTKPLLVISGLRRLLQIVKGGGRRIYRALKSEKETI